MAFPLVKIFNSLKSFTSPSRVLAVVIGGTTTTERILGEIILMLGVLLDTSLYSLNNSAERVITYSWYVS